MEDSRPHETPPLAEELLATDGSGGETVTVLQGCDLGGATDASGCGITAMNIQTAQSGLGGLLFGSLRAPEVEGKKVGVSLWGETGWAGMD